MKLIIKKNLPLACTRGGRCCIVFSWLQWLCVIPVIPIIIVAIPSHCCLPCGAIEKATSTHNPPCEQWLIVAGVGAGSSFHWWLPLILVSY